MLNFSKASRVVMFLIAFVIISLRFVNVTIPNTSGIDLVLEIILQTTILSFLYYVLFTLAYREEKERERWK